MSTDAPADPPGEDDTDRDQVSFTLPEPMLEVVDTELKGTIGTSRSDAIKTALAIYLAENGLLNLREAVVNE